MLNMFKDLSHLPSNIRPIFEASFQRKIRVQSGGDLGKKPFAKNICPLLELISLFFSSQTHFTRTCPKQMNYYTINQGDQMRLWKNRQYCSPNYFLSKLMHSFFLGIK
jgi:hypothetical protein